MPYERDNAVAMQANWHWPADGPPLVGSNASTSSMPTDRSRCWSGLSVVFVEMSWFEFSVDASEAVFLEGEDPAADDEDISDGWRSSGGRTTATSPGMREKEVLILLLPLLLSSSSVNVDDTFRTKLLFAHFALFVFVGLRRVDRPLLVVRRLSPAAASLVSVASVAVSLTSVLEADVLEVPLADLL